MERNRVKFTTTKKAMAKKANSKPKKGERQNDTRKRNIQTGFRRASTNE